MDKIILNGETFNLGGQSQEIYSTDETRIGTWIDGKPLYRKCMLVNNFKFSAANTLESIPGTIIPYLKQLVTFSPTVTWYDNEIAASGFTNISWKFYNKFGNYDGLYGGVMSGGLETTYLNFSFIFEYTKTTDTATQSVSSEALPKSSGTITKDGKQYDYELPEDIVSSAIRSDVRR